MSLWSSSFLGFLLLLLLVLTTSGDAVDSYGEKQVVFPLKKLQSRTWRKGYNLNPSCSSQKSRKENGATILEMKHKDSCSGAVKNWEEWQQKSLADDDIRVRSIQSHIISRKKIEGDSVQAQTPITSGLKLQTLNYIVSISIGSRNMTVIVDTGSDLTWVQCQPCRSCYSQPQPLFNPSLSPSYLSVPCNASACQSLQFATGNLGLCGGNASVCSYSVSYGDGSYTNGELGRDHLVLGTTSVEGFVFGCGRNNKGLFGLASGLMGLGRSDVSLISQTKDVFGGVFSYCLPSTEADDSGSLVFGANPSVFKNTTPVSYAAMLQNPQLYSFYTLNLTGTSIGGVHVQTSGSGGTNGIILDSGTVITRLPPSTYKAVKAEFLKQFSGYPVAPGFSILDTCFDLSAYDEVNIPTVKLHFDGGAAELSVDATGIFYFARRDASQVCLALASLAYEAEIGIIGNYQQRNTRVIYDTKNSHVGFAKETCSFM
nr:aspartyl protease family protein At5g10770-like [Ipomoea batatas]